MKHHPSPTLLILCALATPFMVFSASPTATLTWKVSGYAPARYAGKILPIAGSSITAALMITTTGIVANPSGYTVRWYVDGNMITTKSGSTPFSFSAPRTGKDTIVLRASIPDYQGQTLDVFADIPVVRPEIVINRARYPELIPLFYFFSVRNPSDLTVTWDDTGDAVTVRARNKNNPLEFAQTIFSKRP